jgi:hypothetical protein
VENLNEQYPVLHCRMSLKVHSLHSHVEIFTLIWVLCVKNTGEDLLVPETMDKDTKDNGKGQWW